MTPYTLCLLLHAPVSPVNLLPLPRSEPFVSKNLISASSFQFEQNEVVAKIVRSGP